MLLIMLLTDWLLGNRDLLIYSLRGYFCEGFDRLWMRAVC